MARRKKSDEEKEHDILLANVREMCKHRFGKEFIWHLLGVCDLYSESFTGDERTNYNEGRRAVGLQLLQLLDEADPTAYARLILEKHKLEGNNDGESDSDGTYSSVGTDADTDNND